MRRLSCQCPASSDLQSSRRPQREKNTNAVCHFCTISSRILYDRSGKRWPKMPNAWYGSQNLQLKPSESVSVLFFALHVQRPLLKVDFVNWREKFSWNSGLQFLTLVKSSQTTRKTRPKPVRLAHLNPYCARAARGNALIAVARHPVAKDRTVMVVGGELSELRAKSLFFLLCWLLTRQRLQYGL